MELKDPTAGLILRALAEAWQDRSHDNANDDSFTIGWQKGSTYCGETLSKELDKLNVPHLQEESK